MSATKEEMVRLLDDTVAYYSENTDRRCVGQNEYGTVVCAYDPNFVGKADVSEGCAIGRWMTPWQKNYAETMEKGVSVTQLPNLVIPDILKKFDRLFLRAIQLLHDTDRFWDSAGLSKEGSAFVQTMRTDIHNNLYN